MATPTGKTWDLPTRALHWALAVTITVQMVDSFFIDASGTRAFFYVHEAIGLLAGLIILLHWLWSFANFDIRLLFPWSGDGWETVKAEAHDLLRGRLPAGGREAGLSSFVHGLGLLAVTAMGLTGFFIFLVVPGGRGAMAHSTHYEAFTDLSAVHAFFSWFVWIYLGGHVGSALVHLFRREPVFSEMFLNGGAAEHG
ncbi:MAG TPA: cytochrome b/b6 domain-containing protein [Gammaproteobacteria bacterium]|nr:cytochrome b/b6 domain-containing protein [Gammaproteobacteria bacterium]